MHRQGNMEEYARQSRSRDGASRGKGESRRGGGNKYPILLGSIIALSVVTIVLLGVLIFANPADPTGTGGSLQSNSKNTNLTQTPGNTAGQTDTSDPTATPVTADPARGARIQMTGDFLLHGSTTMRAGLQNDNTYNYKQFLEIIKPYLSGDLVLANMDTPINAYGDGTRYSSWPKFNSPVEIVQAAKYAGITGLITGNNHALDLGYSGLVNTYNSVKSAGVDPIGSYTSKEASQKYYIKECNGIKIGVLAYTDYLNSMDDLPSHSYCIKLISYTGSDRQMIKNDIAGIRAAGAEFVIVAMHWGVEYTDQSTSSMRDLAQAIIDGGADIIMGTHPHSVQELKTKTVTVDGKQKQVLIAYSLGNFFADQRGLDTPMPKTEMGVILTVDIGRNENGDVVIKDSYYTPTYAFRRLISKNGDDTLYYYQVLPAGKYGLAQTRPSFFQTDEEWQSVKDAWTHVTSVMGEAVRANSG